MYIQKPEYQMQKLWHGGCLRDRHLIRKISFADMAYEEKPFTLAGAMAAIDGIGEVSLLDPSFGLSTLAALETFTL